MKKAFLKEFVDEEGKIKSDTMSLYVEAYEFGIIDEKTAKKHLTRKLDQFDDHCVCGMFGTKFILSTLTKLGMKDRAFKMITKKDYPSWGYMIENGATTLWELWDSVIDGKMNIEKISMNSLNHYMLGGCCRWFYTDLLGINPTEDGVGFKKMKFAPVVVKELDFAKGSYLSKQGKITVDWKREGETVNYTLTLPQNMEVEFDFESEVISKEQNIIETNKVYKIALKG
jgi:alpha-L-rhamnosidase